ncbi:putative rad4 family protein [Phaeomoniella chlamydospora]|uniref:Putative rad4 family protein n=1 Tax=Phaeomoniella chlamydospora TaxID=158046 RepID=A0A0G2H5Z6_PHACM|nr:putative rad4 family protein [Phaeomoniella chlamydospora]
MPPFLPRKRLNSTPPDSPRSGSPPPKKFKHADAERQERSTLQQNREFTLGSDNSDSSLSDIESDEFEDVPTGGIATNGAQHDDEDDEEIDWEDAVAHESPAKSSAPEPTGDLQLTLRKAGDDDTYGSLTAALGTKKGPSKIERQIRLQTHCLHVQFLMYHNALRNNWIGNKEVQQILVKQLPRGIQDEIHKWRVRSGLVESPKTQPAKATSTKKGKSKTRGKYGKDEERNERDWGQRSQRLETGKPDMGNGDPLLSLLKVLAAYWKKRFTITAPGLRKHGYQTRQDLKSRIASFQKGQYDPFKHGEKIDNLSHFKSLAKRCEGSRDVGAQLFTALLRGIGIEARMIANLQPLGFGWTKAEEAMRQKQKKPEDSELSAGTDSEDSAEPLSSKSITKSKMPEISNAMSSKKSRCKNRGHEDSPIALDSDNDAPSIVAVDDDSSVVDVTHKVSIRSKYRRYDRDLHFPIYWTEAISPISNKAIPVSPFIGANSVATTDDHFVAFEPRGSKAEKAKQVIAYVIAFSPDGSAKDVTTRYLKRHMWPGKTKGIRLPVEKVAVYNRRGKVKRYEEYDWFKTIMSSYMRRDDKRTAVDELEDSTDLIAQQPEKRNTEQQGDTLQSLRASADFVLERFLRREEALKTTAKPVRKFQTGKGDKAKEEDIYLRKDVVRCLSAESWHKEGRRPKIGEIPLKFVPIRAVTLTRKREAEEQERITGEKPTQGLYSLEQTEYIIPPPIENGIIPKNAYGNIDCFVPSMIPKGAVHIPLRGTVRICKKLEIDYAEAVTGFEFGNKMAVPVITGVVIAKENEDAVIDAWEQHEAQQRAKEEAKQQKGILAMWRKMLMGLRINARMQEEYGDVMRNDRKGHELIDLTTDDGDTTKLPHDNDTGSVGGGGFLMSDEENQSMEQPDLVVEHNDEFTVRRRIGATTSYPASMSAGSNKQISDQSVDQKMRGSISAPLSEIESDSDIQAEDLGGSIPHDSTTASAKRIGTKNTATKLKAGSSAQTEFDDLKDQEEDEGSSSLTSELDSPSEPEEYNPRPTRTRGAGTPNQPQLPKLLETAQRRRRGRPRKFEADHKDENINEIEGGDVQTGMTSPYF